MVSSKFDFKVQTKCIFYLHGEDFLEELILLVVSLILGGMYLMEVDRVLRPGGYWILSGPPSQENSEAEKKKIEELAESICWEKKYENGDISIWRKKLNPESCQSANLCVNSNNADDVWLVLITLFHYFLVILDCTFFYY